MSNKEVLNLRIMGKDITIVCPPKDKPGLEAASELLNEEISAIPDKANALMLASLNLAFKQMTDSSHKEIDKKTNAKIEQLSKSIEKALD
ncbi:MAG: hypothetical protein CMD55_03275 [Gammaproteobacteria bacterium]|jgi:cell division protein ZapA (FtsZ GTPase activity inhibitor)|nr:hypothetical protein [Gammaproteobacteria bacterium]|tara:strand:- start:491 stop:760 length:270 start_codon:yes stop_codon:yes gene_type:complete